MPSHEFPWSLDGVPYDTRKTLRFDVTPLMKAPGDRVMLLLKWLAGKNTLAIEKFSLEHDGKVVFVSEKPGRTGEGWVSQNNSLFFSLPPNTNSSGRWEVSAVVYCKSSKNKDADTSAMSRGVFMFEKSFAGKIDDLNFVGRWAYSHDNHDFVREFYPDGTWKIYLDGKEHIPPGGTLPYTVENGILSMRFNNPNLPLETVTLRDKNTLIFLNRQYRNAWRIE